MNELDILEGMRADVAALTTEARGTARARWESRPAQSAGGAVARRAVAALAATTLLVGGGWWLTRERVHDVKPSSTVPVSHLPRVAATEPQNFLLIGSDSRSFVTSESDRQHFGSVPGARSDTIVVVRVIPATHEVVAVSIPRDLAVTVDGNVVKINSRLNGGPAALIASLRDSFGIPIQHMVEVNFVQFRSLVDELGGLRVAYPASIHDVYTGLVQGPGCQTLDGTRALAFVRSRHFFWQDATGHWISDPRSDFGRMIRQQFALRQLLSAAEHRAGADPTSMLRTLFRYLTVDADFTSDDALRFVDALQAEHHETLLTLPTEGYRVSGMDALRITADAQPVLDFLAGKGDLPTAPSSTQAGTSTPAPPDPSPC